MFTAGDDSFDCPDEARIDEKSQDVAPHSYSVPPLYNISLILVYRCSSLGLNHG